MQWGVAGGFSGSSLGRWGDCEWQTEVRPGIEQTVISHMVRSCAHQLRAQMRQLKGSKRAGDAWAKCLCMPYPTNGSTRDAHNSTPHQLVALECDTNLRSHTWYVRAASHVPFTGGQNGLTGRRTYMSVKFTLLDVPKTPCSSTAAQHRRGTGHAQAQVTRCT